MQQRRMVTAPHVVVRDNVLVANGASGNVPGVTVIVPNYNNARHLPTLVESVRRQQTTEPVELIVVDDVSTDDSLAVLGRFHDVSVIRMQRNTGSEYVPMNVAAARARGRYVAVIDGDDYLVTNDALQAMADALDAHPRATAAISNVVFQIESPSLPPSQAWMMPGGPGVEAASPPANGKLSYPDEIRHLSRRKARDWSIFDQMVHAYHVGLRAFPTDTYRTMGGFPTDMGRIADAGMMLRLAVLQRQDPERSVLPVDNDAYGYRIHGSNVSAEPDAFEPVLRGEVLDAVAALGITYDDLRRASERQRRDGFDAVLDVWQITPEEVALAAGRPSGKSASTGLGVTGS